VRHELEFVFAERIEEALSATIPPLGELLHQDAGIGDGMEESARGLHSPAGHD
jgi:hypothetical protein